MRATAWKEESLTVRTDGNETPCSDAVVEVDNPNVIAQALREGDIFPQQLEGCLALTREQLIKDQQFDPELAALLQDALTEEEAQDQPLCYFQKAWILMCKWRPTTVPSSEEWKVSYQIVIPPNCRVTRSLGMILPDPPEYDENILFERREGVG